MQALERDLFAKKLCLQTCGIVLAVALSLCEVLSLCEHRGAVDLQGESR